jgi:type IV pilus assembly protein PilM
MANFLQNLFASKGEQSVIGIDMGASSIKVVQLKRKGAQAILETYGELSLGPYAGTTVGVATNLPEDKIIEALHDLLTEKDVNITTALCGMSIPFSSALMSVISMPQVGAKELDTMVPLEARKYIPVPISEVTLDWSVIPKNTVEPGVGPEGTTGQSAFESKGAHLPKPAAMMDVLVVAIHNDTLTRYAAVAAKNNLTPSFFEIEIFSIMRSVLDDTRDPVMMFDMGAATTNLFIVERGILKSSHTINRGSQNITESIAKSFGIPEDRAEVMKRDLGLIGKGAEGADILTVSMLTLEYIFEEVNRIVLDFEKKYEKPISKIVMIGGGSSLKGLNEVAKKGFQTEVVSGDPFSKVVTPAFLEDVLHQTGPQFAVAVGLALRRLEEL